MRPNVSKYYKKEHWVSKGETMIKNILVGVNALSILLTGRASPVDAV